MPFGNLTSGSKIFTPASAGIYRLSTITFGMPTEELRFREPTVGKDKKVRQSLSYVVDFDIVMNGATSRCPAMATINYTFDPLIGGGIPTFVNNSLVILNDVVTEGIANRWCLNEV